MAKIRPTTGFGFGMQWDLCAKDACPFEGSRFPFDAGVQEAVTYRLGSFSWAVLDQPRLRIPPCPAFEYHTKSPARRACACSRARPELTGTRKKGMTLDVHFPLQTAGPYFHFTSLWRFCSHHSL